MENVIVNDADFNAAIELAQERADRTRRHHSVWSHYATGRVFVTRGNVPEWAITSREHDCAPAKVAR